MVDIFYMCLIYTIHGVSQPLISAQIDPLKSVDATDLETSTWWRRLWSDRALSCFSEVVLEVQSTIPCKTQDFIHEPCSIDVKKWFKNIGGAPQN